MKRFAEWMAARHGLTDAQVGESVGLSGAQISKIRRGLHKPSTDAAVALERLTGIPAWEFVRPDSAAIGCSMFGSLQFSGACASMLTTDLATCSMPQPSHVAAAETTANEATFCGSEA